MAAPILWLGMIGTMVAALFAINYASDNGALCGVGMPIFDVSQAGSTQPDALSQSARGECRAVHSNPKATCRRVQVQHVPSWAATQVVNETGHNPSYPYKTAWGECLTIRANQATSTPAQCVVKSITLLEMDSPDPSFENFGREIASSHFGEFEDEGDPIRCNLIHDGGNEYHLDENDGTCLGARFHRATCSPSGCTPIYYEDDNPDDGNNTGDMMPAFNTRVSSGNLFMDVAQYPQDVIHWWTIADYDDTWRAPSRPDKHYFVQIVFKTVGDAALRGGLDSYTAGQAISECDAWGDDVPRVNCQAYGGYWYQSRGGFSRLRIPVAPW